MKELESIAERKIREAMEQGAFEHLSGTGRPLNLEENPHEDPEMRLAHHLLHSNGFALPWIEEHRDLEARVAALRSSLKRSSNDCQAAVRTARGTTTSVVAHPAWRSAVQTFREQAADLNRRIRCYNLKAPSSHFHLLVVEVESEIQKVTAS